MESLNEFIANIGGLVWGPYMLTFLVGTGVYLTLRLAFLQVRMLPFALKQAFSKHPNTDNHEGDISHFGALMTALSATIGTGNIAGVATAVVLGGAGAVFWMWVSAFFGMATKYAEGILAVKYRVTNSKGEMSGGPMYYLERGCNLKWLAILFALFGTIASFGIGSSVQSNSVAASLQTSLDIDTWKTGVVLTIFTGLVILGGIKGISRTASIIVPFMAIVYVAGGLIVMFYHADLVIPAIEKILSEAFTGSAALGGAVGLAIRYGVARGVFSNEAGMGSAPIAAAAAKTDHPARQAFVSMTATFLDTMVVCAITGITIVIGLLTIPEGTIAAGTTGASLTVQTFDYLLPGVGGSLVTFGLIFFAYSTILGWCYYGEKCASYVFGDKSVPVYRVIYVLTVLLGTLEFQGDAKSTTEIVWGLSDVFNGLMAIPNLIGLVLLSGVVVKETKDFLERRRKGELP
ncbi:sodium:alanine symporter family protein [Pelistega sp. NLN82]|uniref:Sodium:alanine symporter family protein n=1 Tax=Pelistega ratti TaxID=2652177 RepID=A0A6L9Y5R2_9BURK|nr:sodium:alanine symporter family protein [Pelistega ratti]NEN75555.1 sodium:alanine symporter family protein [Pelistega ratti]